MLITLFVYSFIILCAWHRTEAASAIHWRHSLKHSKSLHSVKKIGIFFEYEEKPECELYNDNQVFKKNLKGKR